MSSVNTFLETGRVFTTLYKGAPHIFRCETRPVTGVHLPFTPEYDYYLELVIDVPEQPNIYYRILCPATKHNTRHIVSYLQTGVTTHIFLELEGVKSNGRA